MVCDSHQVHGLFTVADTVTESSLEASSQLHSLDVRTSRLFGEKVHTVLARADIGFAVGAMRTDTAIETADGALTEDDLRKIPAFVRLFRRHTACWSGTSLWQLASRQHFWP